MEDGEGEEVGVGFDLRLAFSKGKVVSGGLVFGYGREKGKGVGVEAVEGGEVMIW